MSRSFSRLQMVVPPAVVLDAPARRVEDFVGSEIERGRYTLAWDDRMVVDLYAGLPPVERPPGKAEAPPEGVPPAGPGPEVRT